MGRSTEPRPPTLAEAFAQAGIQRGPKCTVATVLAGLGDADRALVESWLTASLTEVSHARITRTLKAVGHHIGADTIRRHRAGECGCDR